jgi:hypothetical protein
MLSMASFLSAMEVQGEGPAPCSTRSEQNIFLAFDELPTLGERRCAEPTRTRPSPRAFWASLSPRSAKGFSAATSLPRGYNLRYSGDEGYTPASPRFPISFPSPPGPLPDKCYPPFGVLFPNGKPRFV